MFEEIGRVWRFAVLEQQTRCGQSVKRDLKVCFMLLHHDGQQSMREFASNGRPDLRYVLGGPKPVKPCHEGCVQTCGNGTRGWNGTDGSLSSLFATRFQHRL